MPKKSESVKGNKSHEMHSPKQDHAQKSGPGARPDNVSGHQKMQHESKPTPGLGNAFDKIGKLGGGKKSKGGCLPKLFMLLLPFAAVGAYFFFNS